VSFNRESLLRELDGLAALSADPTRLVIAFSGGLDSTVLLHALSVSSDVHGKSLLAVYIDHGLHEDSVRWGDHCEEFSRSLEVEFRRLEVDVMTDAGKGTEAAARSARYDVFRSLIREGDWLLSAHHKDDQAETLLLNLMRGSGPAGLAGIGEVQPFGSAISEITRRSMSFPGSMTRPTKTSSLIAITCAMKSCPDSRSVGRRWQIDYAKARYWRVRRRRCWISLATMICRLLAIARIDSHLTR
jgi:tRNA(Ile)-lysidine synthetase-like protein